jgi:hypothetical protein
VGTLGGTRGVLTFGANALRVPTLQVASLGRINPAEVCFWAVSPNSAMETLYAYLAGAIDLDGRISIRRARRGGRQEIDYDYSAVIALSDSDPTVPDLLQATFLARRVQYDARNRKQRAWHMWEAVGQGAQEPLIRLLPYLRVRHRQAELALSLITSMQNDKAGSGRSLSNEQKEARRHLYEQVMMLNSSRPQRTHR